MAVFGLQAMLALVATILAAAFLSESAAPGPLCESQIEDHHEGSLLKGRPSGSAFAAQGPVDKVSAPTRPTTTTTTTTPDPGDKAQSPDCQIPYQGNPDVYDWLQVLEETGGQPGQVNASRKDAEGGHQFQEPCRRPLTPTAAEDQIYQYKHSDFRSLFRSEDAYLRFAGTKFAFVDVRGTVVWKPPASAGDSRVYLATYVQDDTGVWLNVKRSNCTFSPAPALVCKPLPVCRCFEDELICKENKVVGPNLLASLVG